MNRRIEVILPEGAKDLTLYYKKVAEREAFDIAEAEHMLQQDILYDHCVEVGGEDVFSLADMEDGIYQIYLSGDEEYAFVPMLVSMPAWATEDAKELSYEVRVTPKYTKIEQAEPEQITLIETPISQTPKTGDGASGGMFGAFGAISFIIVVIMTCHNRFKCARMTE